MKKLEKIINKYSMIEYSSNYSIGGGLVENKFASNRHEDALNDKGKMTLGECNQMFSKATGLSVAEVRTIILNTFPDLEWHHAGSLPKFYGGGMKKTYFVNAKQIIKLANKLNC
jgi:hypothetical protein